MVSLYFSQRRKLVKNVIVQVCRSRASLSKLCSLPPTSDASEEIVARDRLQVAIWPHSLEPSPPVLEPTYCVEAKVQWLEHPSVDREEVARFNLRRFEALTISIAPLRLCLSEETLKSDGRNSCVSPIMGCLEYNYLRLGASMTSISYIAGLQWTRLHTTTLFVFFYDAICTL